MKSFIKSIKSQSEEKQPSVLNKENAASNDSPSLIGNFLKLVAYGKQLEVEALIKTFPNFLSMKSNVTDHSGRTFKNITALQYAMWAVDVGMVEKILEYMPQEDVQKQLTEFKCNKVEYEIYDKINKKIIHKRENYFDIKPLQQALKTYANDVTPTNSITSAKDDICWATVVGGEQLLLPVWIANAYCMGLTKALNSPLIRTLKLDDDLSFYPSINSKSCDYFLGTHFAVFNRDGLLHGFDNLRAGRRESAFSDSEILSALYNIKFGRIAKLMDQCKLDAKPLKSNNQVSCAIL
jgi:hypothetical protein